MKKPVMLYVFPSYSSFVNQDIQIFSESFDLRIFHFQPGKKLLLPFTLIREKLFLLRYICFYRICVCQFAGYHTLLPVILGKIFRKPCVIVVGGTDCSSFPSINYGNLRKPVLGWFTLQSLKRASHIISPGTSLVKYEYTYTSTDYPGQGFKYFDSSINTPYTIIPNGIDTRIFRLQHDIVRRKNSFLTICNTIDKRNFRLKGLDLFLEMAELFPEFNFTIIGRLTGELEIRKTANVEIIDFVPHNEMPSKMAEHIFYCQLSMSEGFGVALAEAMACGCVPIVSRVGIMDYIIGDTGFILNRKDSGLLSSILRTAISSDVKTLGERASKRISENFSLERRRSELLTVLNTFSQKPRINT